MASNGSIHVDPSVLEEMATSFSSLSEEFAGDTDKAQNLVNELCADWTGKASEAFAEEFSELEPNLRKVEELMEQICQQLKSVASAFQEGDDSIAGQIHA